MCSVAEETSKYPQFKNSTFQALFLEINSPQTGAAQALEREPPLHMKVTLLAFRSCKIRAKFNHFA